MKRLGILLLALIVGTSCIGCQKTSDGVVTTTGSVKGETPARTDKPKTPTPQIDFVYPTDSKDPSVGGDDDEDLDIPRYPVDVIADPSMDVYTDLFAMVEGIKSAPTGTRAEESSQNLFDGYESSKYCVQAGETLEIVWGMVCSVPVSAYALVTANDTQKYPERNPTDWALYGSDDLSSDQWSLIDEQTTTELPAENYAYTGFVLAECANYQYFKLVFRFAEKGSCMQLSEIRLYTDRPDDVGFADSVCPEGCISLFSKIDRSSVSGPSGYGTHTADCLFDNIAFTTASGSNKYCGGSENLVFQWKMTEETVLTDYVLHTANDASSYPERNPVGWTLYGSLDGTEWVEIDRVEDAELPSENYVAKAFQTNQDQAFLYYKIAFELAPGEGCLQLSEISLFTKEK